MPFIRIVFVLIVLLCSTQLMAVDKLETNAGDIFVGRFEKLEAGEVHFTTETAGLVKVATSNVKSIHLDGERAASFRTGGNVKDQQKGNIYSRNGTLIIRTSAGELRVEDLPSIQGINEAVPDDRAKWDVSALGTVAWTEGNTRTYSLGYRFDIKRTTERNFMTLFGRGSYFQDRELEIDPVRERKHHLGYYYSYIFDFKLTVDVTQDLYFNEFAGYRWRSVTGIGPGYYIFKQDKLSWHVAAHATYTFEDQIAGAEDRGYLGARARTEIDWVSANDRAHVNFKSEVLFDFDETRNVVVNNALLAEYKFGGYFTAGLLLEHSFDNLPPEEFAKHDFRLTLTLGISWSGRWH